LAQVALGAVGQDVHGRKVAGASGIGAAVECARVIVVANLLGEVAPGRAAGIERAEVAVVAVGVLDALIIHAVAVVAVGSAENRCGLAAFDDITSPGHARVAVVAIFALEAAASRVNARIDRAVVVVVARDGVEYAIPCLSVARVIRAKAVVIADLGGVLAGVGGVDTNVSGARVTVVAGNGGINATSLSGDAGHSEARLGRADHRGVLASSGCGTSVVRAWISVVTVDRAESALSIGEAGVRGALAVVVAGYGGMSAS